MSSCVVCKNKCEEINEVKCSGGCEGVFHLKCINQDGKKVLRSTKDWKCGECKNTSATGSVNSASSTSNVVTKDFIIKVLEGFKTEVFSELRAFRTEMVDLSKSVQFVSDKLDASSMMMDDLVKQFTIIKKDNDELKLQNHSLRKEVNELQDRMRSIEQYSRKNNVEVSGIPVTAGENVIDIVMDIAAALGVEMGSGDVAAAHRVPTFKKDRQPSLVIQFQYRTMKDVWLTKFREKNSLTSHQVNNRLPHNSRVYINDHLSPENKQFLRNLKQKCRDLGYAYVWSRDGKFFTRKAQGEAVKRINNYSDIENLK